MAAVFLTRDVHINIRNEGKIFRLFYRRTKQTNFLANSVIHTYVRGLVKGNGEGGEILI